MPNTDKAAFLQDEASQILALSDALASAHGPSICAAFDQVARSLGLAHLAANANLLPEELYRALSDREQPDLDVLRSVVEALMHSHSSLCKDDHRGARTE